MGMCAAISGRRSARTAPASQTTPVAQAPNASCFLHPEPVGSRTCARPFLPQRFGAARARFSQRFFSRACGLECAFVTWWPAVGRSDPRRAFLIFVERSEHDGTEQSILARAR